MLLFINKPSGMTSHDVVDRVRKITRERRVGHAGTLDPLAEGLLIVAVGREETKRLSQFSQLPKTYEFMVRLGVRSKTQDMEGPFEFNKGSSWDRHCEEQIDEAIFLHGGLPRGLATARNDKQEGGCSEDKIKTVLASFVGRQQQRIPAYSAKKVGGKKLYELARKGKGVPERWQEIEVYEIELLESGINEFIIPPHQETKKELSSRADPALTVSAGEAWRSPEGMRLPRPRPATSDVGVGARNDSESKDGVTVIGKLPYLKIRARVSSGTYIRQLSEDIAAHLGTWGLAESIKRTAIGEYALKQAHSLERLASTEFQNPKL